MALVSNNSEFDSNDPLNARVLEGVRAERPFSWGQPAGVKVVTAEEAKAQREAIEERQAISAEAAAEQLAVLEALTGTGEIQGTDAFEERFNEALILAVEAKGAEVILAAPNPMTATRADLIRHEERVRADERSKIAEAAKPATGEADELTADRDSSYFDDLGDQLGVDALSEQQDEPDPYAIGEGEFDFTEPYVESWE